MRIASLIVAISLLPAPAIAECWVAGGLKGYSALSGEQYALTKDGISSTDFQVRVEPSRSSVSPSNLPCNYLTPNSIVCGTVENGRSTMEVWAVDPTARKVTYTKAMSGWGPFDGVRAFVGELRDICR
ncbi:hypothetical membrane associated protein [Cupriavidus necator H16]|uniref:Hypothetical membrane associated protein n=1 Tax=Cupriavidus necator (strain ATCC 17699 / DSM 428 / KCTC 22496 / NCIMB 10442 / H16 / Stanier 337) TaxID=381666 RepID=Q0JYK2_CUPNH|nr:hypothetical membrane associated protein [Cupriavidus necator H16]